MAGSEKRHPSHSRAKDFLPKTSSCISRYLQKTVCSISMPADFQARLLLCSARSCGLAPPTLSFLAAFHTAHCLVPCATLPSHGSQPLGGEPNWLLLSGGDSAEPRWRLAARRRDGCRRRLRRCEALDVVRVCARLLARLQEPAFQVSILPPFKKPAEARNA